MYYLCIRRGVHRHRRRRVLVLLLLYPYSIRIHALVGCVSLICGLVQSIPIYIVGKYILEFIQGYNILPTTIAI